MSRLSGRVALITGASRGIGAAVAKRFAAEGAHVILTARTVGGLEEVDDAIRTATGQSATLVPLDLRKTDQIDQLGYSIYERFQRLDILVGNAGVLETLGPVAQFEPKLWDRVMTVNVTANYRLIRTADRLLRASDAGRAIFVTSGAAQAPYPYWGPYAASKAALEMLVRSYAMEIASSNLRVNLIDPGIVATKMRVQAFPGEDQSTLTQPDAITDAFVALAEPACTRHGEIVKAQG
ncbi:SDR family NAD(P)-dependent oxidoreductase [Azospirillum sp. RWY-5-1]|uniref:SDR family NAD(P)-dependent oxidoreductase n=1 Tax=Azospirillum oleiclasticum TaxID=2735135 RepID=A0ABX2T880_9PROT|nr:SDR family NAD(P)-dependent oxidoreductase [Azospirillum oleiclasticum]NYZ12258.1 SDR family NAD(P)-dependent oxidoreductase [Azospirillum oleiclasticum]NYZ19418.1 SDR family NAD(P)-dependent oxidoreductase [Azospirillum oleiclasticum]